jgi:hypothetical protein
MLIGSVSIVIVLVALVIGTVVAENNKLEKGLVPDGWVIKE